MNQVRPPLRGYGSSASSSNLSVSASPAPSLRSRSPSPSSQFVDRAVSFISAYSDEPVARWLRKHADDPVSSAKRWVIEHLQFGICMFDPAGLKARYTNLVAWEATGGVWANYYTHTVKAEHSPESPHAAEPMDEEEALRVNGILPAPSDTSLLSASSTASSDVGNPKAGTASPKRKKKRRHFVVLPTGLGQYLGGMDRWEEVPIAGVDDEVNAHTGIFMSHQNLEYEALVKRVADRVLEWCQRLPTT